MSDHKADSSALKREWLTARVVLIVGFILAIGAGTYLAVTWRANIEQSREQAATEANTRAAAEKQQAAEAAAGTELCRATLAQAQGMGLVPRFAELLSGAPETTKKAGRYVCTATTTSSVFSLGTELDCRDLKNPKCVSLYAVVQNGKTILYKRGQ